MFEGIIEPLETRTFLSITPDPTLVPVESTPQVLAATSIQDLGTTLDHDLTFASSQLKQTMADLNNSTSTYVNRTDASGKWKTVTASDWTSGFLPGAMWQLYDATRDSFWSGKAQAWTLPIGGQTSQEGDLAFRFMTTFNPLYDLTGDPSYRQTLLNAAASKNKMWNETAGVFETTWHKSTSGDPRANLGVIMDQTTDMELLIWAARQTNDQTLLDRVARHVRNVMQYMVRPDGGTYGWGYFDRNTGDFIDGETYQGYSNESTWSRGQAWAIYSFTTIAKELGLNDVLAAAKKVSDYFIVHLPSDYVPYWDFNDPAIPNTYRDSSAAAIAASGFVQLSQLVTDPTASAKYKQAAENILTSLSSTSYLAEGTAFHGILLHGAQNVPNDPNKYGNDVSLIFGDYYFLQAINRYRALGAPTGQLTGFTFDDADRDGIYDAGETKTSGKTVFLDTNNNGALDSGERSVVTGADGAYSFMNLAPGTYHVRRVFPSGWTYSTATIDVTLGAGETVSDLGIGSKPATATASASLSGFTFDDANKNGQYDVGEKKTSGKIVFLDTNNNGKLDSGEKSIVTDASGNFSFTKLAAGTYHVRRVFPSGYTYSTQPIDVTLADGQAIGGLIIGSQPTTSSSTQTGIISGFCFNDTHKDGRYDTGELKTGGKTVFLDSNNNGRLDSGEKSTVTDKNGNFSFTGLAAGTYHVRRVFPSGYTYSTSLVDVVLASGQVFANVAIGSTPT
jgi:unsaturated chondroitin disaccharide hydrolase